MRPDATHVADPRRGPAVVGVSSARWDACRRTEDGLGHAPLSLPESDRGRVAFIPP